MPQMILDNSQFVYQKQFFQTYAHPPETNLTVADSDNIDTGV